MAISASTLTDTSRVHEFCCFVGRICPNTLSLGALFVLALGVVQMRNANAQSEGFQSDRFSLASSTEDGLALRLPNTLGHLNYSATMAIGYVTSPLRSKLGMDDTFEVVGAHTMGELALALGLSDTFELNANLGLRLGQDGDEGMAIGLAGLGTADSAGLSDLTLGGSYAFFETSEGATQLGIRATLSIPTGSQDAFTGDGGVGAGASLLGAHNLSGITLGLEVGAGYRPERNYALLQSGSEVFTRVGLHLPLLDSRLRAMVEVDARTDLHDNRFFTRVGSPMQGLLGGRYQLSSHIHVGAMVGIGLIRASNEPAFRTLLSFSWEGAASGTEEEGRAIASPIPVARKANDGEDTGEDTDGSYPGQIDSDSDGIADEIDQCPEEAEDFDQFSDEDGCPDTDNDQDGVLDSEDLCPLKSGPAADETGNSTRGNGCPNSEKSGDDSTPTTPTPAPPAQDIQAVRKLFPPRATFTAGAVKLSPRLREQLKKLAIYMKGHPNVHLDLRGHASSEGTETANMEISISRAEAVKTQLMDFGVDSMQLHTSGAGESEPLRSDANNPAARKRNRRVEFQLRVQ